VLASGAAIRLRSRCRQASRFGKAASFACAC